MEGGGRGNCIDTALDWLEDSGDDHGISEDLDQDVPEDI
jgi:hypothetical protein